MNTRCVLGTRGSPLALWQARQVQQALQEAHPQLDVPIKIIHTKGDKILDRPLAAIGDKGLFTKELENALYNNTIDIAVHSLKDLPSTLPEGLGILAVMERHLPFDALVTAEEKTLAELPAGALIGTGSLRRKTQLQQLRPDLNFADLRGNIQTRLAKLDRGDYAAIVMAQAALERMDLGHRMAHVFDAHDMLPAVGQGAVAVEGRLNDPHIATLLQPVAHLHTTYCITAERAFLRTLGGGCEKPIAGFATRTESTLSLTGRIASVDGSQIIQDTLTADFTVPTLEICEKLGTELGEKMLAAGGKALLEA